MPDLTWKPGPPPLDVPGLYIGQLNPGFYTRVMLVTPSGAWWEPKSRGIGVTIPYLKAITSHLGPIPSPPTGDET